MQIEHILLFDKIAKEKSISKVAAANHISQPALSQQMKRLEEEVGQRLFERSNRGIELTRAGTIMQKYASQFIKIYDNFQEDIKNLLANVQSVRILATPVAAEYALPCSLFKVQQRFPNCAFSLTAAHSKDIEQSIIADSADIGFIVGKPTLPGLEYSEAFSDKIYLVCKTNYPIKDNINGSELNKHPLIMLNKSTSSYELVVDYMARQGIDPGKLSMVHHLESTEAVKSAVLAEHGLAFLPYMAIKKEIYQKQLKVITLQDFDIDCNVYSIYKERKTNDKEEIYTIIKYFINTVYKSIC